MYVCAYVWLAVYVYHMYVCLFVSLFGCLFV